MKKCFLNSLTILTMMLGSCVFMSCGDDETPSTVSVSTTALNFSADGGSQQITVTSNAKWTISGASGWCTVSPSSGSNTQTVFVTVSPNSTSASQNCVLTISTADGDASAAVVVSQAGKTATSLADAVAGTYVGKMMSGGYVIDDAYKVVLTKLNSTTVEMNASFLSEATNFNVSESQNQYVLTNSSYSNLTITVNDRVLNVSFVNGAGTMTTFSGTKD